MKTKLNYQYSNLTLRYLNYIGIAYPKKPDFQFLEELLIKQILSFGWDTLDLHLNRNISLDPKIIMTKFMDEQRGGVCYELVVVFCHLLNELGFNAYLVSSFTHGYNEHVFNHTIDTHAVIIVTLDNKKYLVDVTWDFREPILLKNQNYFNDGSDEYRLSYNEASKSYFLEKNISLIWKKQYEFSLAESSVSSFYTTLEVVYRDPEFSTYRKTKIMKLTQKGFVAIFDKTFILNENSQKTISLINNTDELKKILKEHFLINPLFVDLYF